MTLQIGTIINMKRMLPVVMLMTVMSLVRCQTPEKMSSSCDNKIKLDCTEGEMIVVHQAAFTPQRGGEGKCDNKQVKYRNLLSKVKTRQMF